jgi:peptidoglycan/xylan/chitin deacetylase (PgdA/CDA1 family)
MLPDLNSTTPSAPNINSTASPAPDSSATPPPAPAPSTPPPSTMLVPRSSLFQTAAYRPASYPLVTYVDATNEAGAPAGPMAAQPAPSTASSNDVEGSVIVLLYHQFVPAGVHISPKLQWTINQDVFESQMKYIHDNGYHVIPMSDLLKFLHHEITVPRASVVITIDDGYKSAIVYGEPILKKYGFPWTFFVYPDFITDHESVGAASWNDLLALQSEGVDIESHSMTHPILVKHRQKIKETSADGKVHSSIRELSPDEYADFLKTETAGAKALLEQKMGKPITCFAYPYGSYNKQVQEAAVAAGYLAIFTVEDNPVHASTSLLSIGRYTITQSVIKNFAAYLHQGALGFEHPQPAPGEITSNPRPVISTQLVYPDGQLNPASLSTSVRDFGEVRHDFDPQTNTVRLYLPRDLVAPEVLVNISVRDARTGQMMVANWFFNYEPAGGAVHPAMPTAPAPGAPSAGPPSATPAPAPTSTPSAAAAQ